MKVEINIDPECREPRVVIHACQMTKEVEELARRLSSPPAETIAAQTDRGVELLNAGDILRIYAERQRVYAQTQSGTYPIKARLYEMERRLEGESFVRTSNSELVNTRMITGMDFSLTGTIRVTLRGGTTTYVSRRRVAEIKKRFEL